MRQIEKNEVVHHIDGEKLNNNPDNLCNFNNDKEHREAHISLEKTAFELFKLGFINFNLETKKYELNKSRIKNI